jgi:hypothetical protein
MDEQVQASVAGREPLAESVGHAERGSGTPIRGGQSSGSRAGWDQPHVGVDWHVANDITKAVAELTSRRKLRTVERGRIRAVGAGRKRVEETDEQLKGELTRIVEATTAGDPMSALRWTNQSTQSIAEELTRRGHPVSDKTVARCLLEMGYSLQLNRKTKEGPQHPDRDAQFRYINRQEAIFRASVNPVISVDTKKKELVGAFQNKGRTWRPQGQPYPVNVHDFPSQAEGKAIPYGTYDVLKNRAVVNIGTSHDPSEFAVESIRRWWRMDGRRRYRAASRLLICADAGAECEAGRSICKTWPMRLGYPLRSVIIRLARANGTEWSTGSSLLSV